MLVNKHSHRVFLCCIGFASNQHMHTNVYLKRFVPETMFSSNLIFSIDSTTNHFYTLNFKTLNFIRFFLKHIHMLLKSAHKPLNAKNLELFEGW